MIKLKFSVNQAVNQTNIALFIEKAVPMLLLALFFTTAFAKVVASMIHSAVILLFFVYLALGRSHVFRQARTLTIIVVVYVGAMVISFANTTSIMSGIQLLNKQVSKLIIIFVLIEFVNMENARKNLYAFAGGGTMLAAVAIFEGLIQHVYRPPTMWNSVHGGNILLFSLITTVVLVISEKENTRRIALLLAGIVTAYALYLNGTRGVWAAFGITMIAMPFTIRSLDIKKKLIILAVILVVAGAVTQTPFVRDKFREARQDIAQYEKGEALHSLGYRIDMWKVSIRMFIEHPLIGVGTGDWHHELERFVRERKAPADILVYAQPHNIFLDALSTRGILGILTFLSIIFYPVVIVQKTVQNDLEPYRILLLLATIAFCVSGMSDTLVYIRGVYISYLLLIGVSLAVFMQKGQSSME